MGEGSAMPNDPQHTPTFIQPYPPPQKTQKPRKPKRKDTQVPQPSGPTDIVADKAVHEELGDSGGPRCQETIGDTIAQTRFENVSKLCNDSLLARGNTLRSDEDSLKLNELMELCTNLQQKVLNLEKTKTTQQNEIAIGISRRVESSGDEEDLGEDASKQERRINAIDADDEITLAKQEVADKDVNLTIDEVTLAQALAALKSVKPKVKGVVIEEPSVPVSAASASIKAKVQDKGKGIMIALKLQAKIDEEEIIAIAEEEKINEANISWDDIQAKVDADYQLVKRLQAEEQEQFTIEEKATLFKELLEQRRKHFAAKRADEKRNNPPTKTQQKKTMITYLKNMEGWKHKYLKSKDFDSIKELFDKAFKRVNMSEPKITFTSL
ncbi:hypothetical protein Tco_1066365 [Tanacetum coccineum]|uniref:Uncharacterized protein n=1 Tax=Tanacetum coccineum TaxID=301880 RepID=A0ABQ5H9V0_9ASTR